MQLEKAIGGPTVRESIYGSRHTISSLVEGLDNSM